MVLRTIESQPNNVPLSVRNDVNFAWLEITPSCTLTCKHCYAQSMPNLGHGKMNFNDWTRVLNELQALGCVTIQLIGGEPTIHPSFCEILEHAVSLGLEVEVYTNLVGISQHMWALFVKHHVRIATSFYTDNAQIHDEITATPGSFGKTLANINKALRLGLLLRAGMVDMQENQRVEEGKMLLEQLGVRNIKTDRIRGVGRGEQILPESPVNALCGSCAKGKLSIISSGMVYPCVFARSFPVGNVFQQSMAEIIQGELLSTRITLQSAFDQRYTSADGCDPEKSGCDPEGTSCDPGSKENQSRKPSTFDKPSFPGCDPDKCPPISGCDPDAKPCDPSSNEDCDPKSECGPHSGK